MKGRTQIKRLWSKSGGKCALCDHLLGTDPKQIVPDHKIAATDGGKNKLSNYYLAHRSCNSSRQHLPFDIAKPIVKFKVFCEHKVGVTFDDVLDEYVGDANSEIEVEETGNSIKLSYKSWSFEANKMVDPATMCEYYFADIPVACIKNDADVQPRQIMYGHVRKLYLNFKERPVHEPSNCRFRPTGDGIGELLQFDGQHKTTAQILLNRDSVPTKIYIDPDIAMLQQLVVKIQQEIKKQPLTRSDTLAKLGDVVKSYLKQYTVAEGQIRTEKGLVEKQSDTKSRAELKKLYFEELRRILFFDEDNELAKFVKPGVMFKPTTDKVVINKVISPLIFSDLLEIDLDSSGGRDNERSMIISILNKICSEQLGEGWHTKGSIQATRARNFFQQGAIGWWMGEILLPALRYATMRIGDKKPLFIDAVTDEQKNNIDALVETLCNWAIWSTGDEDIVRAFRSNTVKNVTELLKSKYSYEKLITEAID